MSYPYIDILVQSRDHVQDFGFVDVVVSIDGKTVVGRRISEPTMYILGAFDVMWKVMGDEFKKVIENWYENKG